MDNQFYKLAVELGTQLKSRDLIATCAESCTGGGIARAITAVPGSSGWFEMGFVTYSNDAKATLLNVDTNLLDQHGAVSEAVVLAMASGARERAGADISVAVSGIAGPDGGSPEKPVGTVWFAWAWRGDAVARCVQFAGSREDVREQAVRAGLKGLLDYGIRPSTV